MLQILGLHVLPAPIQPIGLVGFIGFARFKLFIQLGLKSGLHILDLALGHQTVFDQTFSVKLQGGLLLADARVHRRIGEHGLVALVMTKAAIAEDVDNNIFVELLAEFCRHFCGMNHGFGIIAVHMENRRFHHQSDVGGVGRRARIRRRCGKADLIVDHDVDRAARAVAFQP